MLYYKILRMLPSHDQTSNSPDTSSFNLDRFWEQQQHLHVYNFVSDLHYAHCISELQGNKQQIPDILTFKSQKVRMKDIEINKPKQYIKTVWSWDQSIAKLSKLAQYYRFYDQMPNLFHRKHFALYARYLEDRNEINYQRLQHLLIEKGLRPENQPDEEEHLDPVSNVLSDLESEKKSHRSTETQSAWRLQSTLQEKYGHKQSNNLANIDQQFCFSKKQTVSKRAINSKVSFEFVKTAAIKPDQINVSCSPLLQINPNQRQKEKQRIPKNMSMQRQCKPINQQQTAKAKKRIKAYQSEFSLPKIKKIEKILEARIQESTRVIKRKIDISDRKNKWKQYRARSQENFCAKDLPYFHTFHLKEHLKQKDLIEERQAEAKKKYNQMYMKTQKKTLRASEGQPLHKQFRIRTDIRQMPTQIKQVSGPRLKQHQGKKMTQHISNPSKHCETQEKRNPRRKKANGSKIKLKQNRLSNQHSYRAYTSEIENMENRVRKSNRTRVSRHNFKHC